jgi:glucose-1-phosphate cytidylyltransferase
VNFARLEGIAAVADLEAVVLCGGRGRRLLPLTDRLPKPMVEFHGKPMLDHIIALLQAKGLRRFTLCVGYKGEIIREHYAAAPPGVDMRFSDAGEQASILVRLAAVADSMTERFLCVYGDTFIDLDLDEMLRTHILRKAAMTVVTGKVQSPFGLVRTDNSGWITAFEEKPVMTYYVGCFVAERSVLQNLDDRLLVLPDGRGLVALFERLAAERRLAAFEHTGLQLTFNTPTECENVEKELGQFYTLTEDVEPR